MRTALPSSEGQTVSSITIWKETKRSVKRSCRDEMAVDVDRRVVIAFIDSLKFSRTDIIREISVYVIGCL